MQFNNFEEKRHFLKIVLNKGLHEARKSLPPKVVRYIHKDGKILDENGNQTKIEPSMYLNAIIIHRKIIG